jgi:hypothetical protein
MIGAVKIGLIPVDAEMLIDASVTPATALWRHSFRIPKILQFRGRSMQ